MALLFPALFAKITPVVFRKTQILARGKEQPVIMHTILPA